MGTQLPDVRETFWVVDFNHPINKKLSRWGGRVESNRGPVILDVLWLRVATVEIEPPGVDLTYAESQRDSYPQDKDVRAQHVPDVRPPELRVISEIQARQSRRAIGEKSATTLLKRKLDVSQS
jgi:hypothetical protein